MEESFSPQAHHFSPRIQTRCNLIIGKSFGGHQNHLRALYLKIRQRILSGPTT